MNEVVAKDVCEEKHKQINEKFDRHEKWIGEHEMKIDTLTKSDTKNSTQIEDLCGKIGDLVSTIRWLIGLVIGTLGGGLVGFFFYAIQNHIFK
jgi:hypothetical protein